jgi:hypothetical protein
VAHYRSRSRELEFRGARASLFLLACLRLFATGSAKFLLWTENTVHPTATFEQQIWPFRDSRDATLTNLEKLEAGNYIERSAAVGHAYRYRVQLLTK